ncbi:phage tail tip fiber protein [Enterobacter ludwigii]|uniref:phage tail tip fiber protein n=1 Tax=Enterobacter ludwigii TaxID=299767 RepID=UPI001C8C4339|nr:DUF1983 domain-containing protein [Enterobacter ludwigii]MBX8914473.1 DUF1983 domain-containing protein [Enterobacter ludwigii]
MGQKIITLSGAATDVLYALFFRGALQSGDLPAKSGASELRELGFAETRHTATEYQKENYFTFLTAEGQEFAIKHLANTRFGVPAGGYIGCPIDEPGDGVLSTGYNVKLNVNVTDKGKQHQAGMALDVDDGKSRVKILAEKFAVAANHQNALETALQYSIKKVVDETIQQAMRPGGAIWTSLRRVI